MDQLWAFIGLLVGVFNFCYVLLIMRKIMSDRHHETHYLPPLEREIREREHSLV